MLSLAKGADIIMPNFTRPFTIGTTVLEIVDYSRRDVRAPTPRPRNLAFSMFYPVSNRSGSPLSRLNCTPAIQVPLKTALYLENREPIISGGLQNVSTHACLNAPLSYPSFPLLFFSPGSFSSRYLHSYTLAEIASYGWNVVSVDHPYQTSIVEYLDGRVAYEIPFNGTQEEEDRRAAENIDIHAADLISVLNALTNSTVTAQIPGFSSPVGMPRLPWIRLRTDKVGVLGHSLGGATALRVTANDTRFAVGADMDGGFWGTQRQIGTDAPFMILAGENSTRASFSGWAETWPNLRNFKREYRVHGASHLAFMDLPSYRDLIPDFASNYNDDMGSINGTRSIGIQRAFMNSLFRRFLKGDNDGLLDGLGMEDWPEITNIE